MSVSLQSFLFAHDLESIEPVLAEIGAERVADLDGLDANDWVAMGMPAEQARRLLAALGQDEGTSTESDMRP